MSFHPQKPPLYFVFDCERKQKRHPFSLLSFVKAKSRIAVRANTSQSDTSTREFIDCQMVAVKTLLISAVAATIFSNGLVTSEPSYPRLVPNARQVTVNGVRVVGLGHPSATARSDQGNPNQFGIDLEDAIRRAGGEGNAQAVWSLLCDLDSDGDGRLNKDELCDPNCNSPGQNPACAGGAALTHPGFFDNADGSVSIPNSSLPAQLLLHGSLMIIAWIFLAPFGILRAVYFKKMPGKPVWFRDHKYALMGTVVMTFVGFFAIVSFQGTDVIAQSFNEGTNVAGTHVRIGIFVLLFSIVQPISGFLRAHVHKGEPKTSFRLLWEFQHQWTGRMAAILGVIAVSTGIPLLFVGKEGAANFLIVLLVLVGIGSFGYVLGYREKHVASVKAKQNSSNSKSSAPFATETQAYPVQQAQPAFHQPQQANPNAYHGQPSNGYGRQQFQYEQPQQSSSRFSSGIRKKSGNRSMNHRELSESSGYGAYAVEENNPRFSQNRQTKRMQY